MYFCLIGSEIMDKKYFRLLEKSLPLPDLQTGIINNKRIHGYTTCKKWEIKIFVTKLFNI